MGQCAVFYPEAEQADATILQVLAHTFPLCIGLLDTF
jgi:hypothetical protein